jgi:hypothetical protein
MVAAPLNNNILRAVGLLFACSLFGLSPVAQADTFTYTYTGNPFNQFVGGATCPPICSLSGSFTLAGALPANFSDNIVPLTFSFTDGGVTITQGINTTAEFGVETDSQANIIEWNIYIAAVPTSQGSPGDFQEFSSFLLQGNTFSLVEDSSCKGGICNLDAIEEAFVANDPGTWTSSGVPEPPTLLLFGPGFLGMFGLYMKRDWFFRFAKTIRRVG